MQVLRIHCLNALLNAAQTVEQGLIRILGAIVGWADIGAARAVANAIAGGHGLQLTHHQQQGRADDALGVVLFGKRIELDQNVADGTTPRPAELAIAHISRPMQRPRN